MERFLKNLRLDRYERQARLKPALLTLLPVMVTAAVWLPTVWGAMAGLGGLVAACGMTFLLAKLARYRGRQIEQWLKERVGGRHTTVLLRHSNKSISAATKARYHLFLTRQGITMPTAEAEAHSPEGADEIYRSAVDWLLEATRNDKNHPLLKNENIDYGFRRNLLGLKPLGIVLTGGCLLANSLIAHASYGIDDTRFWTAVMLGGALLGGLLAWIFWARIRFVEDASQSYAIRLLSQCDVLEMVRPKRAKRASAKEPVR